MCSKLAHSFKKLKVNINVTQCLMMFNVAKVHQPVLVPTMGNIKKIHDYINVKSYMKIRLC